MPFARPTLTQLRQQAIADINASDLPGADGLLRRAWLRVLAWVQAGMAHLHYGYLDWIAREGVPFTCDGEFLEGWAGLKSVIRTTATIATGTWTGTGAVGAPLPSGTIIRRSDQVEYTVDTTVNVDGSGNVTAAITAVLAGVDGNADNGTAMSLAVSVTGVNAAGTSGLVTGGTDQETDSSLRTRMLQAYQAPPQGGSLTDYITWALQVPGVTRAWASADSSTGTVYVWTMWDVVEEAFDGFPQGTDGVATDETRDTPATGDQLTVADHIYPLRPVTALVYSVAPSPQTLAFTVAGLVPGTTDIRNAVTAALASMLVMKSSPKADVSIDQSDADAAILAVPGVVSFRVTAPAFPQTPTAGNIFTLGVVTFS